MCAHGASPPPPQVGREVQITWLLQARLKRWEGIKEGSCCLERLPSRNYLRVFCPADSSWKLSTHPASSEGLKSSSVLTAGGCPCTRTQAASEGWTPAFWAEQRQSRWWKIRMRSGSPPLSSGGSLTRPSCMNWWGVTGVLDLCCLYWCLCGVELGARDLQVHVCKRPQT